MKREEGHPNRKRPGRGGEACPRQRSKEDMPREDGSLEARSAERSTDREQQSADAKVVIAQDDEGRNVWSRTGAERSDA
jgi:hypothetical protein